MIVPVLGLQRDGLAVKSAQGSGELLALAARFAKRDPRLVARPVGEVLEAGQRAVDPR